MPIDLTIPRGLINEPPDPARCTMDEQRMEELVSSMRRLGVLEPLLVTPTEAEKWRALACHDPNIIAPYADDGGRFEIMDGHRRYIASGMAGLTEVPCRVYENAEEIKFAIMLDATLCHEDFTAAEEGLLFMELIGKRNWTLTDICKRFHRSESYVNDRVDVATLDESVRDAVISKKITASVAKELLKVKDEQHRRYLLSLTIEHGSNMATVKNYVAQWRANLAIAAGQPAPHTPGHAIASAPVEQPRCVFCQRDDDQGNVTALPIHNYHVRDLKEFLRAAGIRIVE